MAVFTHISEEEIKKIIKNYPELESLEFVSLTPIIEGSSNTNYLLKMKQRTDNEQGI